MRVNSFHPTLHQKRVIARIIASPTPVVAASEISNDVNIVAARDQLMKLGVITFSQDQAELTAAGNQIAADENIIDDAGELTPDGEAAAYGGQRESTPQPSMESVNMGFLRELFNS